MEAAGDGRVVQGYIRLMRPKQWIKNFFVFAPLIFAKELFSADPLVAALRAFAAFCLTASAVYVLNDIADVEADRLHPEKRHRPIASGAIPATRGYILASLLIVAAVLIVLGMNRRFLLLIGVYFLINLAYSLRLKEIVLLDVFTVASGFMLRVLGGAYAIDVRVSSWIVLCTLFISLFLGFAKRRGELVVNQELGTVSQRKVLLRYNVDFLDQMLTITAAGAVISYALYTVAPRTLEIYGTDKMIYTTVFVLYGVFRYLHMVHSGASTENPTTAVTSDMTILVTGVLWIAACVLLIYFGGYIPGFIR
jgi:4-hydroxybenzoate polyprenyltransferase